MRWHGFMGLLPNPDPYAMDVLFDQQPWVRSRAWWELLVADISRRIERRLAVGLVWWSLVMAERVLSLP